MTAPGRQGAPATKTARQARIVAILSREQVHSQEQLAGLLAQYAGLHVTQATLSRDLDELGVVRLRGSDGTLVYALPGDPGGPGSRPGTGLDLSNYPERSEAPATPSAPTPTRADPAPGAPGAANSPPPATAAPSPVPGADTGPSPVPRRRCRPVTRPRRRYRPVTRPRRRCRRVTGPRRRCWRFTRSWRRCRTLTRSRRRCRRFTRGWHRCRRFTRPRRRC